MYTRSPRTTYHISIDANYVLAFLTASIVFALFAFIGLASIAANQSVQDSIADGPETVAVLGFDTL